MKRILLAYCILLVSIQTACSQKQTITTFILVRHAEKANDGTQDPPLTEEGQQRSERLASLLAAAKIDAVYATNYKRTRLTVEPVAKKSGLAVTQYEAFKVEELEKMLKTHAGGTILVSGHSNNIPWIANVLTGKEEYKDFSDADYGNILIVSVVEKGKTAKVTWLRY
jgi:2,3-bisphosphoglycerate-dependent phosphoglycerate mutase